MAKTTFLANNGLARKAWDTALFKDVLKESYFSKFMGEGATNIVQVKNELSKSKGDTINFGLRMRLQGKGVTSGQTLEGMEESLTTYQTAVALEQYRHAVRDRGAMDRQRACFPITEESKDAIQGWATEKIDQLCFDSLLGTSAVPTKIFYKTAGGLTSSSSISAAANALSTANSKLSVAMIQQLRAWCLTGGNRKQIPLQPVKIKGKEYLVLLVHPDVAFDLKQDTSYQNYVQYGQERGEDNPIFTGAIAVIDGIIIHTHENVPLFNNGGGSTVPYAKCAMLGAQSLCWAWGQKPRTVSKEFDYENEIGTSINFIAGVTAPTFNNTVYGSVNVFVARTDTAIL